MFLCQQQVAEGKKKKKSAPCDFIAEEVSSATNCAPPLNLLLENVLAVGYLVPMYQSAESDSATECDVPLTYHEFCDHHDAKVVDWFEDFKGKFPHHK